MTADRDQAHAAITNAYDDATRQPELGQVYAQVAIAHALLDAAEAIREHAKAVESQQQ